MNRKEKITPIPTMLAGAYHHNLSEQKKQELLNRIDRRTETIKNILTLFLWIAITVATVHIAETIKFYNIIHNATIDCIAEERSFNGY